MYHLKLEGHESAITFKWCDSAGLWTIHRFTPTTYTKRSIALSALQRAGLTHSGSAHAGWVYLVHDDGSRERIAQFLDVSTPYSKVESKVLELNTPHKLLSVSTFHRVGSSSFTGKSDQILECDGIRRSYKEWSQEVGLSVPVLRYRIKTLGWTVEEALTRPHKKASACSRDAH